jgi:hypothetical protein
MTLVGKILVVLILIMSLVFMSFTIMVYATHRNWKDLVENPSTGLKAQLDKKTRELQQLDLKRQETLDQLAHEQAARTKAIAVLEVRKLEMEEQLAKKEDELRTLQIDGRNAVKTLDTAQSEMARLKDEVEQLRLEIKNTRQDRNAQVAEVRTLTDRLNQGEGQLKRLKNRNEQLVSELARASLVVEGNGLSLDDPIDKIAPELDGVITAVRNNQLIEVSLGSDEGLRRGHEVDVFTSGGGYLGRAVVVETSNDRSVARILSDFRQGVMRKGDRVATRLL